MEQNRQLSIGSMVYLNSGSSKLKVVDRIVSQLRVEWRSEDGELQTWTLPEVCFRSAEL